MSKGAEEALRRLREANLAKKPAQRQKPTVQRVKAMEAPKQPQNPVSAIMASFGRLGGAARAKKVSAKRRKEIAALGGKAKARNRRADNPA